MPQTYDILTTSSHHKNWRRRVLDQSKKYKAYLTALSIQEIKKMYSIKAVNNFPASNGWQHWKFYYSNKKHTWCHRELTNAITIKGRGLEKQTQSPLKSANKGYPWNLFSTMSANKGYPWSLLNNESPRDCIHGKIEVILR